MARTKKSKPIPMKKPRDPERAGEARLRAVGFGLAGAVVLCVPAAVRHVLAGRDVLPMDGYLSWG